MMKFKSVAAAAATALLVTATGASAAIVTFAQFTNASGGRNVRWVNNGTSGTNGTGGRLYTTATAVGTSPANTATMFSFVQAPLAGLGMIPANFFMDITVASGNAATASGTTRIQAIPTGSFSFTTTAPVVLGTTVFAPGSNLLTGVFTGGTISGSGTSGSFFGDTSGSTLTYTSDFLFFGLTADRDFAMGLTSITQPLFRSTAGGPKALRSFRAFANGSFASNPAPIPFGTIPEPQVWGLMVVGFGLVGVQVRRRRQAPVVTA
jgi:hypothetical protein